MSLERYGELDSSAGRGRGHDESDSPPADPESVARTICLRLLAKAPKTRAQLADALARRDVPDEVAEQVLGRFSDVGLIDDEAFARAWVGSRHAGRGLARRALAYELRSRGVPETDARTALDTINRDEERETARRLVTRRRQALTRLEPQVQYRRLIGMLARKGYPPDIAHQVVSEVLRDTEGADVIEVEIGIDDSYW